MVVSSACSGRELETNGDGERTAWADDGTVSEEELETGEWIVIGGGERTDDGTVSEEELKMGEGIVIKGDKRIAWADDGTVSEEELETGEGIVI